MSTTSIESGTPTFITAEIKQKDSFTNSLAKLAGTDAKHDFSATYAIFDKIQNGLPKSDWDGKFFDESNSLSSVLRLPATTAPISLKKLIPIATDVETKTPLPIAFGISYHSDNATPLHNYSGIKVIIKNSSGKFTNGAKFVETCKLANSVLVVDFNQNGFLEMLTTEKPAGNDIVNYVMIPELLNDPAGKTPLDDTIFKKYNNGNGTGINLRPLLDITNKTVVYNAYDKTSEEYLNNFFSTYNLQLSPIITTKQMSGKTQNLHVTLKISSMMDATRYVEVKNCKKENSIKSLLKFLTSLFQKTTPDSKFNYSAKLQQKRSGDWFQALACLDIYNRDFGPLVNDRPVRFTASDNKVYFVTHDQIACAYALTMGVNAIFINEKHAYVLTNQLTETTSTPEQRLRDTYKLFIYSQVESVGKLTNTFEISQGFTDLIRFLNGYVDLRNKYINTYDTAIDNSLQKFKDKIRSITTCPDGATAKELALLINILFANCVMYCHMIISLPDPSKTIEILNKTDTQELFRSTDDITDENAIKINTFVDAYNNAVCIQQQHNSSFGESNKWIAALQKSDAYTSALVWNWDYKKSGRVRNFLKAVAGQTPQRDNDMYLFLSFIGSIEDAIARKIMSVFVGYDTVIQKTNTNKALRIWEKDLFVSNNNELIKQIRVFLSRDEINFAADKLYFNTKMENGNETAAASLYIDSNGNITNITPDDVDEPKYWGRCTESVLASENTKSIELDNKNPVCDTTLTLETAYQEASCDNIQTTVVESTDIVVPESGVIVGGFKTDVETIGKQFQIVTDISIQQTSVPTLNAFLIYGYMTDVGKQLLTAINADNTNSPYTVEDGIISTDDNLQMGGAFDINDVKISDTSIAYHPLLPIYMIACGYNYNVTPNLEGSLDYDVYIKYLGFLEKMTSVLTGYNYLSNAGQNKSKNIAKSYIVGLALRELLFTLNRDEDGIKIICENGANSALNATRDEYQSFSLMSSMLSDYISGKILEDATEKAFGIQLLQSSVFKNFINVEVGIKSLLNKTLTQQEESISISELNQRSLDLINKISERIVKDRSLASGNASQGITSSQLSTIRMNTGRMSTPDTSISSPLTPPLSVGGLLKTKKRKRKNNRNLKTKRRKNKRSNKKSKKKHRRRKQSKKAINQESMNSATS